MVSFRGDMENEIEAGFEGVYTSNVRLRLLLSPWYSAPQLRLSFLVPILGM